MENIQERVEAIADAAKEASRGLPKEVTDAADAAFSLMTDQLVDVFIKDGDTADCISFERMMGTAIAVKTFSSVLDVLLESNPEELFAMFNEDE